MHAAAWNLTSNIPCEATQNFDAIIRYLRELSLAQKSCRMYPCSFDPCYACHQCSKCKVLQCSETFEDISEVYSDPNKTEQY